MANLAGIKETYLVVKGVAAGQDGSATALATAIDCKGKDRVCFELLTSANADTGVIDMEILEGPTTSPNTVVKKVTYETGGDDDTIYILDVPITQRYVKTRYQRKTANTTILGGTLSVYHGKKLPSAQNTAVKGRTIV